MFLLIAVKWLWVHHISPWHVYLTHLLVLSSITVTSKVSTKARNSSALTLRAPYTISNLKDPWFFLQAQLWKNPPFSRDVSTEKNHTRYIQATLKLHGRTEGEFGRKMWHLKVLVIMAFKNSIIYEHSFFLFSEEWWPSYYYVSWGNSRDAHEND